MAPKSSSSSKASSSSSKASTSTSKSTWTIVSNAASKWLAPWYALAKNQPTTTTSTSKASTPSTSWGGSSSGTTTYTNAQTGKSVTVKNSDLASFSPETIAALGKATSSGSVTSVSSWAPATPTTAPKLSAPTTNVKWEKLSPQAQAIVNAARAKLTPAQQQASLSSFQAAWWQISTPVQTSTTPSGVTKTNALAQLKAKNITPAQYESIVGTPPPTQATSVVTPGIVTAPTTNIWTKTISQEKYDKLVADATAQWKTKEQIDAAMKKAWLTISSTPQIQPNTQQDIIQNKQTITAPNGKTYDVTVNPDWTASFVSQDGSGQVKKFATAEAAKQAIAAGNPWGWQLQVNQWLAEDRLNLEEEKKPYTESEIPAINELTEFAENMQNEYMKTALQAKSDLQSYIDQMKVTNTETWTALDQVITDRFAAMDTNFADIKKSINDLETKANNLFDVNKMIARQNRAKQLADAGILTSEQAWSAANYSMQDYVMNVELKRTELMEQAQEAMTNALKEKAALQDQITQQQWVDAVTKQNMAQQVNTMYQNMVNGYADRVTQANTQFDTAIQNARAKQLEIDIQKKLPLIQEEWARDLTATQKASANSDPQYRYQYILDKFGEIDSNLKSFVASIMWEYQKNWTFMSKPVDQLISELAKKAQWAYKSYNTTSTPTWTPTAATPTAATPTSTTPASTTTQSSGWTVAPQTVKLDFWFKPVTQFNPNMSTVSATYGTV